MLARPVIAIHAKEDDFLGGRRLVHGKNVRHRQDE
jgi:hypothetical protein